MMRDEYRREQMEAQSDDDVTETYELGQGEPLTQAIVRGVSTVLNRDPTEIEPLYSTVDTDALDALFRPINGNRRSSGKVRFDYCGCTVTATASGIITIETRAESERLEVCR